MKKEVENKKSFIRVLSCSESSGDETEKAKLKIDKEELRKYLQNSDEEDKSTQKTSPKKTKKLVKKRNTKKRKIKVILFFKINRLNQLKN